MEETSRTSFFEYYNNLRWFKLPLDMVGEIAGLLESPKDCLNLISGTNLCDSSARQIIRHCPNKTRNSILHARFSLPMILHTFEDAVKLPFLYSVLDKEVYKMPNFGLDFTNKRIVAAWKGWIMVTDIKPTLESSISLLNPGTSQQIALPSWSSFSISASIQINFSTLNRVLVVSLDSTTDINKCSVFALAGNTGYVHYCRIGNAGTGNKWRCLFPHFCNISDLTVYKDVLYAVQFNGSLFTMELKYPYERSRPSFVIRRDQHEVTLKNYIVKSVSGELLLISRLRRYAPNPNSNETGSFKVHKLVVKKDAYYSGESAECATWEELESLGARVLFVGYNGAKCFDSRLYPGMQQDCIYFAHDFGRRDLTGEGNIGVYYMKDKRVEYFLEGIISSAHSQMPAVWFSPNW